MNMVENDFRGETLGMQTHSFHQIRALQAFTSPGQLSTSVVVVSCPPCCMPVIITGLRLARQRKRLQYNRPDRSLKLRVCNVFAAMFDNISMRWVGYEIIRIIAGDKTA